MLDFGHLAPDHKRVHILALSGGGFRGLYTIRVLEHLEKRAGRRCREIFDVIAGTSIGGILAIGLSQGIPASRLREELAEHGPTIFHRKRFHFGALLGSRYGSGPLRTAIEKILNDEGGTTTRADMPLSEVGVPLLVTAVDQSASTTRLLQSGGLAGGEASTMSLMDVALATSAAPTYLPVHRYQGRNYVDGGLVANAPDLTAVLQVAANMGTELGKIHVLSVGTAGAIPTGSLDPAGAPGLLGWLLRYKLFDLTMRAQESLVRSQLPILLPGRYFRIDSTPPKAIALDRADRSTAQRLMQLADDEIERIERENADTWQKYCSHKAAPQLSATGLPEHARSLV